MEISKLEIELIQALDEALKQGYSIIDDKWGEEEPKKCCCAIGALVVVEQSSFLYFIFEVPARFHQRFNSIDNFWAFVKGFGPIANEWAHETNPYFVLGRKLKTKYNPKSHKDIQT